MELDVLFNLLLFCYLSDHYVDWFFAVKPTTIVQFAYLHLPERNLQIGADFGGQMKDYPLVGLN